MRILLVEDDELIAQPLTQALIDQHHLVDHAIDGQTGWELAESLTYDLILLDVMLPKLDGMSLCRRLRSQGNQTPILLLTAQDNSSNKVQGLDAGADDYVAKPFDLQELLARIRALLRRGNPALPPLLQWRSLQMDPSACIVTCQQQPLHLTPKEYGVLELLLRNPQRIFSCSALIDHLWSYEEPPTEETVRSHVKGLRQKLKAAGIGEDPIATIYGIGYRLKPAESTTSKAPNTTATPIPEPADPPLTVQISQQVNDIWEQVKGTLSDRVTVIEQATHLWLENQLDETLRQQAQQNAHKLVGSLGMFGSEVGSQLARDIETYFLSECLDASKKTYLRRSVQDLRRSLQSVGTQASPETLSDRLSADAAPTTEATLLIVDDDPQILSALECILTPWGFRVVTLTEPQQLFQTLATTQPDLLILDVAMPQISGIALCQDLRQQPQWSSLPILFLTAYTDSATMQRVFAAGADDYVSKPISGPELVTRILNRLERSRLLRTLSETDALTGLYNRQTSTQALMRLLQDRDAPQPPFSFAILDLDRLKQINHAYGHAAADRVLARLGELLRRTFPPPQVVGRWGGTEFVLGLPGVNKRQGVKQLTAVLKQWRQIQFPGANHTLFQMTFSAAVAQYPLDGTDLSCLYQVADGTLDHIKATGGNRVLATQ